MTPEEVLDALVDAGVIETDTDGEHLAFTEAFRERRDEVADRLPTADDPEATVSELLGDETTAERLVALGGDNVAFLSYFVSFVEFADRDVAFEDAVRCVVSVYQLLDAPSYPEHTPTQFLDVDGDWLDVYVRSAGTAVVFLWRHDCPGCELVRDDLDELFDEPDTDLGLFAVYGTPHAEELRRRFDVVGAPTLLFVVDGRVDARMQGPPQPTAIENEIEYLRGV